MADVFVGVEAAAPDAFLPGFESCGDLEQFAGDVFTGSTQSQRGAVQVWVTLLLRDDAGKAGGVDPGGHDGVEGDGDQGQPAELLDLAAEFKKAARIDE